MEFLTKLSSPGSANRILHPQPSKVRVHRNGRSAAKQNGGSKVRIVNLDIHIAFTAQSGPTLYTDFAVAQLSKPIAYETGSRPCVVIGRTTAEKA